MQIEKVSRLITVAINGAVAFESGSTRSVIMSLPRVRFLEDGEESLPPPAIAESEMKATFPLYAMKPVSPREAEAMKLKEQGKSLGEIAGIMKISVTCAGSYIATAKRKISYQDGASQLSQK